MNEDARRVDPGRDEWVPLSPWAMILAVLLLAAIVGMVFCTNGTSQFGREGANTPYPLDPR